MEQTVLKPRALDLDMLGKLELALKGAAGDAVNAILSAAAMNFQKLQRFFGLFCCRLLVLLWQSFSRRAPVLAV